MAEKIEIIRCANCEYFANGKQGFFCTNSSGMAYPGPGDYCSKALLSTRKEDGGFTLEGLLSLAMDMHRKK